MPHKHKLSLFSAVIINLNIMIGVGIFLNTTELAKRAGVLGMLGYLCVGTLLLPLVFSIMKLLERFPAGGFYAYGQKTMHPFAGFISTWCYLMAKLSSGLLVTHSFVIILQAIFPALAQYNPLILDVGLLALVVLLNMQNMKTGSSIQGYLMAVKLFPVFFVLITGAAFVQGANFSSFHQIWSGIPKSLPLVMHAMIGFEAACAISSKIRNPKKNAPKAILISYGLVILIYCLYQLSFYGMLGLDLSFASDYRSAFPLLVQKILPNENIFKVVLPNVLLFSISASALSTCFGIIYTNMWNVYSLAQHKHMFFANAFAKLNKHHIPTLCVLFEGFVCLLYLMVSRGNQVPLQQVSALGCTITYTISTLGLFVIRFKEQNISRLLLLPLLGLINCGILMYFEINNLLHEGIRSLGLFVSVVAFGIFMFWATRTTKKNTINKQSKKLA